MTLDDHIWYYDRDGRPLDRMSYYKLAEDMAYKRVEETTIEGLFWVSTVWLGLDHRMVGLGPPLIFETMVFPIHDGEPSMGEELWEFTRRYSTEAEAHEGHGSTVLLVRYALEYGDLRGSNGTDEADQERGTTRPADPDR
jgi:hypothetical protein